MFHYFDHRNSSARQSQTLLRHRKNVNSLRRKAATNEEFRGNFKKTRIRTRCGGTVRFKCELKFREFS